MNEKEPKTLEEQLEILASRGICMDDPSEYDKAKDLLKRVGYYKLVNGYKKLFIDTPKDDKNGIEEQFKEGTSLSELYSVYYFDKELRELMLKYILPVEVHIKSLLSLEISKKYGQDNYLRYQNFDTSRSNSNNQITKVISDIYNQIAYRESDPCIKHYLTEYGFIPLWVLNNVLTFGTLSNLYRILKQPDRQAISREFGITDELLIGILRYLTDIRNISAHGNRLYCMRTKKPLPNTPVHSNLCINSSLGEYDYGKRDLYAALIALKYLISKNEFNKLICELKINVNELNNHLHTISIGEVLEEMGFPKRWKMIKHVDKC